MRQLALLHFRNIITLSVKLEDALARARARVPPAVVQMLLVLQVRRARGGCAQPGDGHRRHVPGSPETEPEMWVWGHVTSQRWGRAGVGRDSQEKPGREQEAAGAEKELDEGVGSFTRRPAREPTGSPGVWTECPSRAAGPGLYSPIGQSLRLGATASRSPQQFQTFPKDLFWKLLRPKPCGGHGTLQFASLSHCHSPRMSTVNRPILQVGK